MILLSDVEERLLHVCLRSRLAFAFQPESKLGIPLHGLGSKVERNSLHSRYGSDGVVQLAESSANRGRSVAERLGGREVESEDVARVKTGVHAPKIGETADHEASANEQNHGERHFESNEDALHAMTGTAATATRFLERVVNLGGRAFEGGNQAKQDSCENRSSKSEEQNTGVEMNFVGAGQSFREKLQGSFCAPRGEENTEHTTRESKQNRFGEELAYNANFTGAECGANGELPGSTGGAREKEVGNVGAGDQQDESNGGEKNKKKGANIAGDIFFQGYERGAGILVGVRIDLREMRSNGSHVRIGLGESDTWFQPSHSI